MTAPQSQNVYQSLIQQIALAQKLTIKAIQSKNVQNLIFMILNDTYHLIPYDRAVLWEFNTDQSPRLLGVSGQATHTTSTELAQKWQEVVSNIKRTDELRVLTADDFENDHPYQAYQKAKASTILWVPLWKEGNSEVILWLEKWEGDHAAVFTKEKIQILEEYLIPGYKAAWTK